MTNKTIILTATAVVAGAIYVNACVNSFRVLRSLRADNEPVQKFANLDSIDGFLNPEGPYSTGF